MGQRPRRRLCSAGPLGLVHVFFDYLVAEDLIDGNPMAAIRKPKLKRGRAKVLKASDVAARLLDTADAPDPRAKKPWPERDLALVATLLVTGVRLGELLALTTQSIDGPVGARRLHVVGKGGAERTIPVDAALERMLDEYLVSRRKRFPRRNRAPKRIGTENRSKDAHHPRFRDDPRVAFGRFSWLLSGEVARAGVVSA